MTNEETRPTPIMNALSILALGRTLYSSERALTAWIRTSVSLYMFGFSITMFIDYLEHQMGDVGSMAALRRVGILLLLIGVVALVLAVVEHLKRLQKLKNLGLPKDSRVPLPLAGAVVLFVIGIATVSGIITNWPA